MLAHCSAVGGVLWAAGLVLFYEPRVQNIEPLRRYGNFDRNDRTADRETPATTKSEYCGLKTRFIHNIHKLFAHSENEDALTGSEFDQAFIYIQCR